MHPSTAHKMVSVPGGHSCLSQHVNHFVKITSVLEMGKGVDVKYLDFAKAFDKLDHGITLKKLNFLELTAYLAAGLQPSL